MRKHGARAEVDVFILVGRGQAVEDVRPGAARKRQQQNDTEERFFHTAMIQYLRLFFAEPQGP
ncbi:MAG: hypothetical protein COT18_13025 [Elusimicrobia bacterium CG08_land_8_20_14_0_20_59_10]|nr:MAG: hypothetical protein COT18_13025 [Elusimicrobia bacterium CG08_land_8_20_14_0_20_59_10]